MKPQLSVQAVAEWLEKARENCEVLRANNQNRDADDRVFEALLQALGPREAILRDNETAQLQLGNELRLVGPAALMEWLKQHPAHFRDVQEMIDIVVEDYLTYGALPQ